MSLQVWTHPWLAVRFLNLYFSLVIAYQIKADCDSACFECSTTMHLSYWLHCFCYLLVLHLYSETLVLRQQGISSEQRALLSAAAVLHRCAGSGNSWSVLTHTAPPMFSLIPILSCIKQLHLSSCGAVAFWMSPTHNTLPGSLDLCLPPSLWCSCVGGCFSSFHPQCLPPTPNTASLDLHRQLPKVRSSACYVQFHTSRVYLR